MYRTENPGMQDRYLLNPQIALSFNGRTSVFGAEYRGSSPRGAAMGVLV